MNFSIKKIILKNIIKLLLLNRIKLINNIQSVEMKQNNGLNIKGQYPNNRLHVWNNNNNYINILYNWNKSNLINNQMINKILSNIISKYFNIKINNISGNNISNSIIIKYIISEPIFKNTNDKINIILFIYNNKLRYINKNNTSKNQSLSESILLKRIINNITLNESINIKSNSLINEIEKLINKKIIIEPIILKYDYFNNNIFSKNISNNINGSSNLGSTASKYSRILNNNVTLLNRMNIKDTSLKNNTILHNIINNNILLNNTKGVAPQSESVNGANITSTGGAHKEYLNINNTIWNLLNNKYIIGFTFKFTGKSPNALSTARKLTYIKNYGSLNQGNKDFASGSNMTQSLKHGITNKSNISISRRASNWSNINKNGKFNISIKLGHI